MFENYFFSHRPPNLKTSSTPSRTQLKLQLQKQQIEEESERKAIESQQETYQKESESKVEMQSIGLDVPPQILQVMISILYNLDLFNILSILSRFKQN